MAIIAHGTGGKDSRSTLQHGDGRGVSIHALIAKDGTIYQMVPDARGANHAGAPTSSFTLNGRTYTGAAVNVVTLGVELENMQDGRDSYPDAQLAAMGWLIAHWRARFGPLPILRHADLDPTRRRDPYQLSVNDMERWVATVSPPPAPVKKAYTVRGLPIYQRQSLDGPVVDVLPTGAPIEIDMAYPNGAGHDARGRGFVDLQGLQETIT